VSIREVWTEEVGDGLQITEVEITEEHPRGGVDRRRGWDLYCDRCNDFECSFVSEEEARAAIEEHVHQVSP
jgi:hypothetical protein